MIIHILNILEMALGIILVFFAAIVWSVFRKFSSAVLALAALFVYISVVLGLLDHYRIIDREHILLFRGIPLLRYLPTFLVLLSLIITLLIFFREEKGLR
ncbi:MAG: hypothetical protein AMS17_02015 [Spirochaetes bacterium DG_61]|jgi:hypothetical protein|nr:MAG: hypothetical protein AMS17_02015 [Spirochaetes bacterium DG_61]